MIRIEIETENDAFQGCAFNRALQLQKIFDRLALSVVQGDKSGKIMDENGNTVGKWEDS